MCAGRLIYYFDDFGTRTILKKQLEEPAHLSVTAFALGGIIVDAEEVSDVADLVSKFCQRWNVPVLHGHKIRGGRSKFSFLKKCEECKKQFFEELTNLMLDDRLTAHGCVICRPGYRDRYANSDRDGPRWEMCKTAFDVSVERAAKFARTQNKTLSVVYEKTGKVEDRLLEKYHRELKSHGTGFDEGNASIYSPLTQQDFSDTLEGIRGHSKENQLLQLADLVLHPICHRTTGQPNRAFDDLERKEMLIDHRHRSEEISIKYSCFDGEYGNWNK